jgi:hypothetical protein
MSKKEENKKECPAHLLKIVNFNTFLIFTLSD